MTYNGPPAPVKTTHHPSEQPPATPSDFQLSVMEKCEEIRGLLFAKNADYGDSALNPKRVFSKASPVEQLRVRIDDKLSRIATRGDKNYNEDTVMDLVGYLVLYMIACEQVGAAVSEVMK